MKNRYSHSAKPVWFFIVTLFLIQVAKATDVAAPVAFISAKSEIENMLTGKTLLNYERAIFLTENAYHNNELSEKDFAELIEFHTNNIRQLIKANSKKTLKDFSSTLLKSAERQLKEYEAALANYAIFLYMTDTTFFLEQNKILYHLPYVYSNSDPLGTLDFTNTQVNKLLYSEQQQGNCFALTSLFKIFSERLGSNAIVCTAPGHIYIRHADDRGIYHNVELGSKSFPGTGSISVITYTTDQALKNDISLRELDLKQSVGLCLIYLAKGYEHQTNTKASSFAFDCAELALKYDSLNLNAMLLKAEVLEARLIQQNKTVAQLQSDKQFQQYQKLLVHLFDLGYREMPSEQKRMIIEKLRNPEMMIARVNQMQEQSKQKSFETRTATLSWGLFDEEMRTKPVEVFGRTAFNSSTKKISKFLAADTTDNYPIDLIVFAWCVDPLAAQYPNISPYAAFGNNPIVLVDDDGRKNIIYLQILPSTAAKLTKADVEKIRATTQQSFKDMGLKTKVVIYDASKRGAFSIKNLDKSDAVAVIGSTKEIKQFAKAQGDVSTYSTWQGGSSNPERSQNNGSIIGVDVNSLDQAKSDLKTSPDKAAALFIIHGAGHNSGMNHWSSDDGPTNMPNIMTDYPVIVGKLNPGTYVNNVLDPNGNSMTTYTTDPRVNSVSDPLKPENNAETIPKLIDKFTNEEPQDNYNTNRDAPH